MNLKPGITQQNSPEADEVLPHLPAHKSLRCPRCNSIVYSRKACVCGVCAEPLPQNFLFSAEETLHVRALLRKEQSRHRKWMLRRDDYAWNLVALQ